MCTLFKKDAFTCSDIASKITVLKVVLRCYGIVILHKTTLKIRFNTSYRTNQHLVFC